MLDYAGDFCAHYAGLCQNFLKRRARRTSRGLWACGFGVATSGAELQDWSDQQVAAWLRDVLKFEDVAQVVMEQGVDGATATEMIRDDWVELGVSGFKAAKVVAQLKKLV